MRTAPPGTDCRMCKVAVHNACEKWEPNMSYQSQIHHSLSISLSLSHTHTHTNTHTHTHIHTHTHTHTHRYTHTHTHTCTHTHTHTFSVFPLLWSTVMCVSPWKQPIQHCSHTAVHWFTASFCSELVVGLGSAFENWKCRVVTIHFTLCGSVWTHLSFLYHHFS